MTNPGGGYSGRRRHRATAALARLARLGLLVVVVVIGTAQAASAHDSLERSDPPNGGMVAIGRTELTLWFGEPVDERQSSFGVRRTDPGAASVRTTATIDEGDGAVRLATPPLERGTYTITWAVVGDDGHPTSGTITFGAGLRPTGATTQGPTGPGPWGPALRLADLTGLLVAIGALAVAGRVLAALGPVGAALRPRVLRVGAVAALVSLAAAVTTPVLRARDQLGSSGGPGDAVAGAVRDLLGESTWGRLWLLRVVVATVAAVALWRSVPGRARGTAARSGALTRWTDPLVVAAAALIASAGLDAWAGHASTLPARTTVAVLAATLHVVAAGVWAGGLVVVLFGLRPLTRLAPVNRRGLAPAAWRAFSPMAAVAAGVLAATGVYLAGRQVQTLSTVPASTYGRAVAAKVLLLAAALLIASYTTLVVNPRLADRVLGGRVTWRPVPRRPATSVTAEVAVLAIAVAVAALMTTVPTARETSAAATLSAPAHATVDGFFVTFEAVPSGANQRVVVRTEPVVRPVESPVTGVEVAVAAPTQADPAATGARIPLRESEAGRFEGALTDPAVGDWTATVLLHRAGRPDSVLVVPWSTGSAAAATPLELTTSALALLLLTGIGSAVALVAAHRRRTPQDAVMDAVYLPSDDAAATGPVVARLVAHRPDTDTLTLPRRGGSHP